MAEESPLVESPLSASVPLPESEYVGGMERENNVEIKREAPENDSNDKTDVLAVKALSNSDVANLILKIGRVVLPRAMVRWRSVLRGVGYIDPGVQLLGIFHMYMLLRCRWNEILRGC